MTDQEKIEFASNVFESMHTSHVDRLAHGKARRKMIGDQIARGEKPTGYRVDWLADSAMKIIDALGQIAQDFDQKHHDDKASVSDLADILATALEIMKRYEKP